MLFSTCTITPFLWSIDHKPGFVTEDLFTGPSSCMASTLTGHVTHWASWVGVYDSVYQFLPISSNFAQPERTWRIGLTFHRPQTTTWFTLCKKDVLRRMRSPVAFYCGQYKSHCALFMVCDQLLDMAHLCSRMNYTSKGEPHTLTYFKWFVNNIWQKWWYSVCGKGFWCMS